VTTQYQIFYKKFNVNFIIIRNEILIIITPLILLSCTEAHTINVSLHSTKGLL